MKNCLDKRIMSDTKLEIERLKTKKTPKSRKIGTRSKARIQSLERYYEYLENQANANM